MILRRANIYVHVSVLATACAVVGGLAAMGKFNSMMNFPVVFAAVCLILGIMGVWRDRARGSVATRVLILLVGASIATAGWVYQGRLIRERLAATQIEVFASLGGKPAPQLADLEPLSTEPGDLQAAASFSSRATIIAFWATWCSPCWAEMAELQELYQEHRENGLTVLALAEFDRPDDEAGRQNDRQKAERFLRKRGFTYPAAITANAEIYRAYQVRSIPSTALVDSSGTLVAYGVGLVGARSLMAKAEAMVTNGAETGR